MTTFAWHCYTGGGRFSRFPLPQAFPLIMHLTPLTFSEILDGTFTLYRRHFLTLFLTTLLPAIPLALLSLLMLGGAGLGAENPSAGSMAVFFVAAIISMIGGLVIAGALTWEVAQAVADEPFSAGAALRQGLRSFVPLLGAAITLYLGMVIVGLGVVMLFIFLFNLVVPGGGAMGAVAGILGVLVVFAVGLVLLATFFAVPSAIVLEGKGPLQALGRSWRLARGDRLRILGIVVIMGLIFMLPTMAILTVAGAGGMYSAEGVQSYNLLRLLLEQVVGVLGYALAMPLFIAGLVLLYFDRRVRTEAYDLELATERLAAAR